MYTSPLGGIEPPALHSCWLYRLSYKGMLPGFPGRGIVKGCCAVCSGCQDAPNHLQHEEREEHHERLSHRVWHVGRQAARFKKEDL